MQRSTIGFLAVFFALFFSTSHPAGARQSSSPELRTATNDQGPAQAAHDCERSATALAAAPQELQPAPDATDVAGAVAKDVTEVIADRTVNLDRDMNLLKQKQTALTQCISLSDSDDEGPDSPLVCGGELLVNFEMRHDGEQERDIPIGRLRGTSAFFYESGMTIDADGAPNAYHPDNVGLDDLANAGSPGSWPGLAKDADGEPYVQGPDDPFPGYYVSETALADRSKPANDPTRYVDASKIPFVVLPGGMSRQLGARPGDFAVVFNPRNGKSSYAIFGDVGPFDRIGEGSMALAENLGIRSDARNGGARRGILYLIFPGSGNGRPRTIEEINSEGQRLLLEWENSELPAGCTRQRAEEKTERGGAN